MEQVEKVYETEENRINEKRILTHVCTAWGGTFDSMPDQYTTDSRIYKYGKLRGIMEAKCRPNVYRYGPWAKKEYMISKAKIERGLRDSDRLRVPFFLAIEFKECIQGLRVPRLILEPQYCWIDGRRDRNDPRDIEMCCHIPLDLFLPIKNENKIRECLPGFEETN